MKNIMKKVVNIEEFKTKLKGKEQIVAAVHTQKQIIIYGDMGEIMSVTTDIGVFKNINYHKAELENYKRQYISPSSKEVLA